MAPRSLFGRMVLAIAVVSITFQAFAIAVVAALALVPLGQQATEDLASLMVDSAGAWHRADADERQRIGERLQRVHRLTILEPKDSLDDFARVLPYWYFLESALTAHTGRPIVLRTSSGADGQPWYWADLPAGPGIVRIGFPSGRIAVQPSRALLLMLGVGVVVILLTATTMARWLVRPLANLAAATRPVGQGRRPSPLPETGPAELAALAREFNRMATQVEELLANRTTLLAGISHDLRSPLARIRLALGMFSERPEPDLLHRMMRDVDAMNDLIARCLDISHDFAERDAIPVNLGELLSAVAAEHDQTGVNIRGPRGPECRLRVRPLALRRILSNLIDNAVQHGGGKPIDIDYRIADQRVEICVADRGPGIPDESIEAVFRPFFRLESSRSSGTGGSGLGLAIVRQIADANGWTVALRPRPDGGTLACVSAAIDSHSPGG